MEYVTYQEIEPEYQHNIPNFSEIRFPNFLIEEQLNPGYISDEYMDDLLNKLITPKQLESSDTQQTTSLDTISGNSTDASEALKQAVEKHLGETYSNAKRLSPGFSDCSGFVNKVYKELGIDLKGAASMYMWSKLTDHIDIDLVKPGDLVFLTPKPGKSRNVAGSHRRAGIDSSHVALVMKREGTRVLVAESTGGRRKSDYHWYELGNPNAPSGNGVTNYSKGNKSNVGNELLGFGRLRV